MATASQEISAHQSNASYDIPPSPKDILAKERVQTPTNWQTQVLRQDFENGLGSAETDESLLEAAFAGSQYAGSSDNGCHQDLSLQLQPKTGSTSRVGGYYIDLFLHQLDPKYICSICFQVLRNAIQTKCGHRFCESCIQNLRKTRGTPNAPCPIDREPLTQVFADVFCRREISSFRIRCRNFARGCSWEGELIDLDKHLKLKCDLEMIKCPNVGCDQHLLRKHLNEHVQKECLFRMVTCEHCKQLVLYSDFKIHVSDFCSDILKVCPYNCGAVLPRKELPRHLTKCVESISACSFREMGCTFTGTRSEVKVHENNGVSATQHLDLACKVITDKMNEMAILKANSDKKDSLLASLSSKVKQLESKMDQQASTYEHRFQQLDDTLCRSTAPRHSDEPLRTRVLSLERVSTTNDKNVKAIQCQLTEIHSEMQKLSQKANNGAALADSHDLRLLGLEMAGYNGVLVWKVHFEKAMADAKRNVKMSVYSPPFYTSRYGFKMCARLYPLGDGIGRLTHISFFFVVMMGENDTILPWPFRQRVTLTLLDQSPARRHISETFLPDVNSSSFQQPTSGMNVASGCPRFVSHELLEPKRNAYLKDGVMFLKVSVDQTGLDQL